MSFLAIISLMFGIFIWACGNSLRDDNEPVALFFNFVGIAIFVAALRWGI